MSTLANGCCLVLGVIGVFRQERGAFNDVRECRLAADHDGPHLSCGYGCCTIRALTLEERQWRDVQFMAALSRRAAEDVASYRSALDAAETELAAAVERLEQLR